MSTNTKEQIATEDMMKMHCEQRLSGSALPSIVQALATRRLADAAERIAAALEAANAREMYPFVFPPAAPPSVPMNPLNPVI